MLPMRPPAKLLGLATLTTLLSIFCPPLAALSSLQPDAAFAQVTSPSARKAEADRLSQQGIEQYRVSQFQEALQSWEQALAIYREIGDRANEVNTLNSIGLVYRRLSQYSQALQAYQNALRIYGEIQQDSFTEGVLLNNIGMIQNYLGQYQQAIVDLDQALIIFRDVNDLNGEAT
jgi:tetratricopeptide (TPR) repeat protein